MSIRADSIVQVTSFYLDFNAGESQVRRLSVRGAFARVLARGISGLGGYSPFASPNQSTSAARITLSATGGSLSGTVTPAQPGRAMRLQRLDNDRKGKLRDGTPRSRTSNQGQRVCDERAWITVAEPPLAADGSAFSATVTRPGFCRADLPAGASGYAGGSPEIRVDL